MESTKSEHRCIICGAKEGSVCPKYTGVELISELPCQLVTEEEYLKNAKKEQKS